jgi:hypothetical protein
MNFTLDVSSRASLYIIPEDSNLKVYGREKLGAQAVADATRTAREEFAR